MAFLLTTCAEGHQKLDEKREEVEREREREGERKEIFIASAFFICREKLVRFGSRRTGSGDPGLRKVSPSTGLRFGLVSRSPVESVLGKYPEKSSGVFWIPDGAHVL